MSDNELNLGFKDFLESEPEKFKEFLEDKLKQRNAPQDAHAVT
jgi:hypothetical protein